MKIIYNGESREVDPGITVATLLREMKLTTHRVAVEVNLDVVPRGRQEEFVLREGDRIEVVTLVGGG